MAATARASEVIARFGGQSALARSLGLNQSTVQHWAKTGQIPSWRHEQVLQAAQERGIVLDWRELARRGGGGGSTGGEGDARKRGPSLGFSRAAAVPSAPPTSPDGGVSVVYGRGDTMPYVDRDMGALREQLGELREMVAKLLEEVALLRRERLPEEDSTLEAGGQQGSGRR